VSNEAGNGRAQLMRRVGDELALANVQPPSTLQIDRSTHPPAAALSAGTAAVFERPQLPRRARLNLAAHRQQGFEP